MNNDRFKIRTPYYVGEKFAGFQYWEFENGQVKPIGEYWESWVSKRDKLTAKPDEQCTGLKDKNGNLIYDEDNVKIGNGSINGEVMEFKLVVEWIDKVGRWNLPDWISNTPDWSHYVEIIGNRHQTSITKKGRRMSNLTQDFAEKVVTMFCPTTKVKITDGSDGIYLTKINEIHCGKDWSVSGLLHEIAHAKYYLEENKTGHDGRYADILTKITDEYMSSDIYYLYQDSKSKRTQPLTDDFLSDNNLRQKLNQAQDALKKARELYNSLAISHCEMADSFSTSYGRLKTFEQEAEEYMKEYDKEITSVTTQDKE